MKIPGIDDLDTRMDLLTGIPNSLNLRQNQSPRTHLSQIVKALAHAELETGERELKILIENAQSRVEGDRLYNQLEERYQQYERCPLKNHESERENTGASTTPNPGMSYNGYQFREKIAEIEYWLVVTAPHQLTRPILEDLQATILGALNALRPANAYSSDAVRTYMYQARDTLSLAIVELDKSGVTARYVKHITLLQNNLEKALQHW